MCTHDLQGKLLSASTAAATLLGYSVEELLQIPMRDLVDPEFRSQFDSYLQEIQRAGQAHGLLAVMTRSGERRVWEYHNTLQTEGVETPIVHGMARDVTERKRVESLLATSDRRFRVLYDRSPIGILLADPQDGRILQVNPMCCEITGRSEQELKALDLPSIAHPDDVATTAKRLHELAKGQLESYEMEKRYVRPDGSIRWVNVIVVPIWAAEGKHPSCVMAMLQDITDRKRAEEALRHSEEHFRMLVEQASDGIGMVDTNGKWIDINSAGAEMLGLTREEFLGREVGANVVAEEKPRVAHELAELHAGQVGRYEFTVRRKDGALFPCEISAKRLPQGSVQVIARDITERKQAEEALQEAERKYEEVFDHVSDSICLFDVTEAGRFQLTDLNAAAEKLCGTSAGVVGKFLEELTPPETLDYVMPYFRQCVESGQSECYSEEHAGSDGQRYLYTALFPVRRDDGGVGRLIVVHQDVTELHQVAEGLREAKEKLTEEKLYLEEEINTELDFDEIIGRSKILRDVMERVVIVAGSDATVLLLGETGTGKELVARALHQKSQRQGQAFVKMNCAAIPSGLLESELFGYEKGAFTGATGQKAGRLELADKGTLFLDEIGEIPLVLQPKLLHVLQDHEFERLGGTRTLKSDFRLIAATNRDLLQSVKEGQFRTDLYYRLNVFPIRVPSLRERREDIPLLVEHFVRRFALRLNKSITSVPMKTMRALTQWDWPGNVRELENFIERSVILTNGSVLACPLGELSSDVGRSANDTLEDVERKHILDALRESRGQLSGPTGAAARLGLKRTTLQSKLKQLGIDHRLYRDSEKRHTA